MILSIYQFISWQRLHKCLPEEVVRLNLMLFSFVRSFILLTLCSMQLFMIDDVLHTNKKATHTLTHTTPFCTRNSDWCFFVRCCCCCVSDFQRYKWVWVDVWSACRSSVCACVPHVCVTLSQTCCARLHVRACGFKLPTPQVTNQQHTHRYMFWRYIYLYMCWIFGRVCVYDCDCDVFAV